MADKKDWELVLKNNEDDKARLVKQYELALPQLDLIIDLAKKRVAEFPDDKKDDPMPEEVKEIIKEVIK